MITGAATRVLNCYKDANLLGFTELCEEAGYPTDLGGYYIRQLVSAKYLIKTARGQYEITPLGKQQLIVLSSTNAKATVSHPRLCTLLVPKQADKFVVMRRTLQPFIGFAEWAAVSMKAGESMDDAVARTIDTRIGAPGAPAFIGFFRRIDLYNGTVFDDKLFAVHFCEVSPDATVAAKMEFGTNELLTRDEVLAVERPARALLDALYFYESPQPYIEIRYDLSLDDISAAM